MLLAASTARTSKSYVPSGNAFRLPTYGELQVVHAPGTAPSNVRRHCAVAPTSARNDHVGARFEATLGGVPVIVGATGATVSRMYVTVDAVPVLPAWSVAQTRNV